MRKAMFFMLLLTAIMSCKKQTQKAPPISPVPTKSILSFPLKDEACVAGTIVSSNLNLLTFRWTASANTDNYDLTIRNLETGGIITQNTAKTELEVSLNRNTPYAWFVTSKSSTSTTTTVSDTWKFYNSGPGIVSFAPFPADIVAPLMRQNISAVASKITLDWTGSDADNDVVNYDVYFGTTTTPGILRLTLVESILNDITVASNTNYFWKVITRDSRGNTSDSGIYQFKVN